MGFAGRSFRQLLTPRGSRDFCGLRDFYDELLCSLVAVLRPDPRLNAGRSEMLHEERGGSQEGHPPGRLDVESLERESSASGSTSDSRGLLERPVTWPANNAYYSSLTKEDGDPLLCVWLLVEQIVDGSM